MSESPIMATTDEQIYHPRDAIAIGTESFLVVGGFGALIAGIQNTLARQNVGAIGFFTKFGSTTAVFAAMGGAYGFTKIFAANLRQKDDSWNSAIGGFFGGSMIGLRVRTTPSFFGYSISLAIASAVFDYCGNSISGYKKDELVDEIDRKTELRQFRRKPAEWTIAELGEGRGIYGPGYEQRRRARILEKYGIDLTNVPSCR